MNYFHLEGEIYKKTDTNGGGYQSEATWYCKLVKKEKVGKQSDFPRVLEAVYSIF
ncbi:hypothetical protein [Coxiella endosymbiont of Ornithodoros amblus]|uniref:hypothetical protein n=1 Tax=Coxiella endosymbiont of Ornithodoros amblus TaxID=1656166 RepID=UPI00244E5B85|nr:hypothetical protein [Coxiella endosymbiont of Ornithodoros amblus]